MFKFIGKQKGWKKLVQFFTNLDLLGKKKKAQAEKQRKFVQNIHKLIHYKAKPKSELPEPVRALLQKVEDDWRKNASQDWADGEIAPSMINTVAQVAISKTQSLMENKNLTAKERAEAMLKVWNESTAKIQLYIATATEDELNGDDNTKEWMRYQVTRNLY